MSYLTFQDAGPQVGGAAFQSMTDALDPAPQVVPKQHFVEWFSGDALDSIWNFNDVSGTGSVAMLDEAGGGLRVTPGTTAFNASQLDFGATLHYSRDSSVWHYVVRESTATSGRMYVGLGNGNFNGANTVHAFFDTTGNIDLKTGAVETASTVAQSTDWLKVKLELRASSATLTLNGTLEVVATSTLPGADLQPIFARQFLAAGNVGDIKYFEVYNG